MSQPPLASQGWPLAGPGTARDCRGWRTVNKQKNVQVAPTIHTPRASSASAKGPVRSGWLLWAEPFREPSWLNPPPCGQSSATPRDRDHLFALISRRRCRPGHRRSCLCHERAERVALERGRPLGREGAPAWSAVWTAAICAVSASLLTFRRGSTRRTTCQACRGAPRGDSDGVGIERCHHRKSPHRLSR
jgi:hypothetical protein